MLRARFVAMPAPTLLHNLLIDDSLRELTLRGEPGS
jgi:hypothetical protein